MIFILSDYGSLLKTIKLKFPNIKMSRKLHSVQEVSEMLNISTWHLYRLVEERRIEHIRLGKKILFSEKQIDQIIEKNTVQEREY